MIDVVNIRLGYLGRDYNRRKYKSDLIWIFKGWERDSSGKVWVEGVNICNVK